MHIPAGHTFIITEGYYDSYQVKGLYVAALPITDTILKKLSLPILNGKWGSMDSFIKTLIDKGYITPLPCSELFLGDESGLDITFTPIE